MKILKFGGTSVATAEAIRATQTIVSTSPGPVAVVVSALGGVTDLLLELASKAASQDPGYAQVLQNIEKRHLDCIRELLPPSGHSAVIGKVKTDLNVLETLAEGLQVCRHRGHGGASRPA